MLHSDVLIDRVGHIKLGDFGTSTICTDNQSPRTSFVGTQDYVSPEVLAGDRMATKACDLWAVGCMVFQFFTGRSPFHGATEYLTFELIMGHCKNTKPLEFPESIQTVTEDLIMKLLKPEERERLGAGEEDGDNGYQALKNHPFFDGVDWNNLQNCTPPYKPDPSKFPSTENMRDGAEDDWLLEGEATPITPYHHVSELSSHAHQHIPSISTDSNESTKWSKFLRVDEKQVFTSVVFKRKVKLCSVHYLTNRN
jgi:3-phosphoinositide dependent protein kinase-1